MHTPEAVLKIRLNWSPPTDPRGNITGYKASVTVIVHLWSCVNKKYLLLYVCYIFPQVTVDGVAETLVSGVTYTSPEFGPNSQHRFLIHAINGFGDGESIEISAMNSFSGTYCSYCSFLY